MPIISNFPTGDSAFQRAAEQGYSGSEQQFYQQLAKADDIVTVDDGANISMDESIGAGPYDIEFTEDPVEQITPDSIGAASQDLSNVPAGSVTADKLSGDITGESIPVSKSDNTPISTSLSNKAASTLGQVTESDLLAWADKQTLSGAFGIIPSITTEGVPVVGWYHGFLEVKNGGRRITLTESAGQYRTWTNCTSSGKWTKWMQQATATAPQEVPLPLVSGVNKLNVASIYKTQENIVFINAWVNFNNSVNANTETQVAIAPVTMRPKETVGCSAIVDSGGDKNMNFARISIDKDGIVRILSSVSFSYAVFSIMYLAES